jgi:hypothetical protein
VINERKGKNKIFRGASTLSLLPPNQHSRAIAVSKSGHVAIGTNEGELSIRRIHVIIFVIEGPWHINLGLKDFQRVDRGDKVLP